MIRIAEDHAALRAEGHRCSRGRVERLMRRHRIRALAGRRFRPCTTDSRHSLPIAPKLLAQRFVAPVPNRIWLAGITPAFAGAGSYRDNRDRMHSALGYITPEQAERGTAG